MIVRQYKAVIRQRKTETRRTSTKDTYKVGHVYSIVPKRAKPTVWYRWLNLKIDIWHEHYSPSTPQPLPFDQTNWAPLRVRILSKNWEPLHDITEAGAIAEGIISVPMLVDGKTEGWYMCDLLRHTFPTAVEAYAHLWDTINGKSKEFCWSANPLVCVHKFELVVEK